MRKSVGYLLATGTLAGLSAATLQWRYLHNQQRAEEHWYNTQVQPLEIGQVERLRILPLIDWYTAGPEFQGEAGVSYLLEADDIRILFDVGFNTKKEHPSPLLRNAEHLGIDLTQVDMIVISHHHPDHVGGMEAQLHNTFALSAQPLNLHGIPAYVPEPMHHSTAQVIQINEPQQLCPGIASTGPIQRALFFFGLVKEQALAINVAGKGIVLVVGCGHQGLQHILERMQKLFPDLPLYGIVGGLHYPATGSRLSKFGLPAQRFLGTGKPPWNPITKAEVIANIAFLQEENPHLVSLSAHDSCDWSLAAFRGAFGAAYHDLKVGLPIEIGAEESK